MWGIKLKGFIRQVDLSYSQGYDDNGGEDNIKYNKDNDDMNNKDNNDYFFSKLSVVIYFQNHELKPKWMILDIFVIIHFGLSL